MVMSLDNAVAVAGELLATDPAPVDRVHAKMPWLEMHMPPIGEIGWAEIAGAIFVVMLGQWLAAHAEKAETKVVDLAAGDLLKS